MSESQNYAELLALKKQHLDLAAKFDTLARRQEERMRPLTTRDFDELSKIQARADEGFLAWNVRAFPPNTREPPDDYRRRVFASLCDRSPQWRAKADSVREMDGEILRRMEGQIVQDAISAARSDWRVPEGELRRIEKRDLAGHTHVEYYGQPSAWMNPIAGSVRQYVKRINLPHF